MSLTDEQRKTAHAVLRWIEVAQAAGHFRDRLPDRADADHSALLARLLAGKLWLPHPPPCAYANPWYAAVEEQRVGAGKEGRYSTWAPSFSADHQHVVIHQAAYAVMGPHAAGGWVIRDANRETPYRWRLYREEPVGDLVPASWWMTLTEGRP